MCYPEKNLQLISAHCHAKWRRERRAFYIISFVLIGVTLISGLLEGPVTPIRSGVADCAGGDINEDGILVGVSVAVLSVGVD